MWTQETLKETVKEKLADFLLVIVSNRQPFTHIVKSQKIICQREAGGLVTALHPVMQAAQGTWIAAGSRPSDFQVLNKDRKVMLPPENPSYGLRRISLSKEDIDGYYNGYASEGLWPLCHISYTRPIFTAANWESYQKVNRMFAETVLKEIGDQKAFVWVQDFHLVLVGKYLREANRSNIITSIFWHIPWPNLEVFQIFPQKKEILEGLLAYDLVGFQIRYHADNFLEAVNRELECRIDKEKNSVTYQNHETLVRNFPISVDREDISKKAASEGTVDRRKQLREEFDLENKKLVVSVDRIDYTKGIPERLRAIDLFFEKYPSYKGKVVFFQLGQISRIHLPRYKELNDSINAMVEEVNWKHSQNGWSPVIFSRNYMAYDDILVLYRMANACIVSSLHDGMNLVAKEFVAARSDGQGVLILSQFTGVARELTDALIINPYDRDSFADAIGQALNMSPDDQEKRMKKMNETLAQNNIYRWAGKVLSQLLKFEFKEEGYETSVGILGESKRRP